MKSGTMAGRTCATGGTLNVEAPSQYSTVAAGSPGNWHRPDAYYRAIQSVKDRYKDLGMAFGVFFDRKTYGHNR